MPNILTAKRIARLSHVGRMIVTVFTAGFVFPHSFVEGMDAPKVVPVPAAKAPVQK